MPFGLDVASHRHSIVHARTTGQKDHRHRIFLRYAPAWRPRSGGLPKWGPLKYKLLPEKSRPPSYGSLICISTISGDKWKNTTRKFLLTCRCGE